MFKNYILTSWRNLTKYKGYTAVNSIGLILGISAFIILGLYVWEDLSFNKFNSNYDRIARVLTIDKARGVSSQRVGVSYPALATAMKDNIPEVEETVRIIANGQSPFRFQDEFYTAEALYLTENSFFKIFDFELIEGTYDDVLTKPQTIVITEEFAQKIFGTTAVLGKSIENQQGVLLEIVGVMNNVPKSSHFDFEVLQALVPTQEQEGFAQYLESWTSISVQTYVLFDQPREVAPYADQLREIAMDNGGYEMFFPTLQALSDVHLNSSEVLFEVNNRKSDMSNVFIMSAIGLLVLVLACFNYVNLVTARSTSRAKEIGIRKVSGGKKSQLITQHLTESIFQVVLAFLVSLIVVYITVPFFNSTYSRFADVDALLNPSFIIFSIVGILFIGFLSGIYPSLVLSSFAPVTVLKGSFNAGSKGAFLRHSLVVLQFMISVALLAGTIVIYQQMEYIFSADLGYEREQIVTLNTGQVNQESVTLYEELSRIPGVVSVGASSQQVGSGYGRSTVSPEGISSDENIITSVTNINENYLPTMGMQIDEGRNFSEAFSDSGRSVIVNQAFLKMLDWETGTGKELTFGANGDNPATMEIVGVVSDFHFATVKHEVEPLIMFYSRSLPVVSVKVAATNIGSTISSIETTWNTLLTSTPFSYTFLDDSFAQQYNTEQTLAKIIRHFSILAISIAAVGLFILSVFTVQQRRKEIGIRKVLGASSQGISLLLGRDFLKWIFISNVIGLPLAWFLLREWLSNFRYRIDLELTPFLIALFISMIIAAVTISIQSFKAATENPIKSLKND